MNIVMEEGEKIVVQRKERPREFIYAIRKLIYEKGNITGRQKLLWIINNQQRLISNPDCVESLKDWVISSTHYMESFEVLLES